MRLFFRYMRWVRIVVGLLVFFLITLQFVDIYHALPKPYFMYNPTGSQFLPSLLKLLAGFGIVSCWAFITFSVLALIAGRAYCSFVCPFGILMDILRRIAIFPSTSKWLKNSGLGKFCRKNFASNKYAPARNVMRTSFLLLAVIAILFGYTSLLGLIDPYSLYGKIMGGILHPAAAMGADWLGLTLSKFDIYAIPAVDGNPAVPLASFGLAILILAALWLASALKGRLYCNTLCPVGAFLGFLAKFSLLKIRINKDACVSCGLCERNCKAQCIDVKSKTLDYSRCVDCFDCGAGCPRNAISFSTGFGAKKSDNSEKESLRKTSAKVSEKARIAELSSGPGIGRREFSASLLPMAVLLGVAAEKDSKFGFRGRGAGGPGRGAGLGGGGACGLGAGACESVDETIYTPFPSKGDRPDKRLSLPPGAQSLENFAEHCTGCQICVSACKAQILKPAITEYGLSGFMQPYMDFAEGFCLYTCHSCTKVCPTGAIKFLSLPQKRTTKIGTAIFKPSLCVVKTDGTDCSACGEHCPVQAIEMIPFGDRKKSLFIPKVHEEVCIGCGACEYICPVSPHKAIVVRGLRVQGVAEEFNESKRFYKPPEDNRKTSAPVQTGGNPFPF